MTYTVTGERKTQTANSKTGSSKSMGMSPTDNGILGSTSMTVPRRRRHTPSPTATTPRLCGRV